MAKKIKKDKLKSVVAGKAKSGFVSPMAQYMKYGDFNPKNVATGTLKHRARYYDPETTSRVSYGALARGQGYTAFRHSGKLWKINPSDGPDIERKV